MLPLYKYMMILWILPQSQTEGCQFFSPGYKKALQIYNCLDLGLESNFSVVQLLELAAFILDWKLYFIAFSSIKQLKKLINL